MDTKWMKRIIPRLAAVFLVLILVALQVVPVWAADPGTSTSSSLAQTTQQHKMWYSNGRAWLIFYDGTNAVYTSSTDNGSTWAGTATFKLNASSNNLASYFDGTYIHAVDCSNPFNLYYYRGSPQAGGTITPDPGDAGNWVNTGITNVNSPSITVLANSYVVVTYNTRTSETGHVIISDNVGAGWHTASNNTLQSDNTTHVGKALTLPSSKSYVAMGRNSQILQGYHSDAWATAENISTGNLSGSGYWNAIVDSTGIIHTVWVSGANTYYRQRSAAGVWGVETSISTQTNYPSLYFDETNNVLYMVYANTTTDSFYYLRCINGTWDTTAVTWFTDADELTSVSGYSVKGFNSNGLFYLQYAAKTGSPYTEKVRFISTPAVTTDNVSYSIDKNGNLSGNFGFSLTDNGSASALALRTGYSKTSDNTAPYSYSSNTTVSNNATIAYYQQAFTVAGALGETWYYRSTADGRGAGIERSFTISAPTISTNASTTRAVDKDGAVNVYISGNVTNMGNTSSVWGRFNYGPTVAYGTSSSNQTVSGIGLVSANITSGLVANTTYHYRLQTAVGSDNTNGADQSFTIVPPTNGTSAASGIGWSGGSFKATLNSNISTMGDASSTYYRWRYSKDPAMVSTVYQSTERSATTAGNQSETISLPSVGTWYFQSETRVGTYIAYGPTMSFATSGSAASTTSNTVFLIYTISCVLFVGGLAVAGFKTGNPWLLFGSVITLLVAYAVMKGLFGV